MVDSKRLDEIIKTHSRTEAIDSASITVLNSFLKSKGKINTNFKSCDKWPNTDGNFELMCDEGYEKVLIQNFIVQIKSTTLYSEEKEKIKYNLKNLSFFAYVCKEITLDPCILFLILNPEERGEERVFWKYVSADFLNKIDFSKNSVTITFDKDDEILNTNESVDNFCDKLKDISERHSFVKRLSNKNYSIDDLNRIIKRCDEEIMFWLNNINDLNRDSISQYLLNKLYDLCTSVLLIHAINKVNKSVDLQFAWENALLDIHTKYLSSFLKMIMYINNHVPEDGQSERLMVKYYDYLWRIRNDLKQYGYVILTNLEKFNIEIKSLTDTKLYNDIANAIRNIDEKDKGLSFKNRYIIQKKSAFYVNEERYFELSLQLDGKYSTKYNRITVYTKEDISTNYSISITYVLAKIKLWNVDVPIKIVTKWSVSIDPRCLNYLSKILNIKTTIRSNNKEYEELMLFLTKTGMSILNLIDFERIDFNEIIEKIYSKDTNSTFKNILKLLHNKFNNKSNDICGKNTIRYLIGRMKEIDFEDVSPSSNNDNLLSNGDYFLSSGCYPFEKNPYIFNLVGTKMNRYYISKDVINACGFDKLKVNIPYLIIKNLIGNTKEIYFKKEDILRVIKKEDIDNYNNSLENWDIKNGYSIKEKNDYYYIDSFETYTKNILNKLIEMSSFENASQVTLNKKYIDENDLSKYDQEKINALQNVFVHSNVLIVYGAAGTGKTTLINCISSIMKDKKKLFLSKTNSSLYNIKNRIKNNKENSEFMTIDKFNRKNISNIYNIIFIDECSTIGNLNMDNFFKKININNTLLVLSGDIYQLESIDFGNWFYYAKDIIKKEAIVELNNTWRTEKENLISLWAAVRQKSELITEKLAMDGPFSENVSDNILESKDDDEIILCLNYDGKFGVNFINEYFQEANDCQGIVWNGWIYKKNDKIIFIETKRFPILYNNLKGKIYDIERKNYSISFTVDVEMILTEEDCRKNEIEFIYGDEHFTRIKFEVIENSEQINDEKIRMKTIIPFQLAYALTIHKAQGLEYNSVKIIISDDKINQISHEVFYTAITRAKKYLKIYWSPETMNKIISSFYKEKSDSISLSILKEDLKQIN